MVTFEYRWLFNRGDYMGRFDCNCCMVSGLETRNF
jgi:hypothetical protein